jgi:uncharacterized protein involved in tolerance to divalent cations
VSSSDPQVVLVLTTIAAEADGAALGRTLVDERLAACVNVLPAMTSVYRWKGQVEQDREQQLIIKTTRTGWRPWRPGSANCTATTARVPVMRAGGGSDAYLRGWRSQC